MTTSKKYRFDPNPVNTHMLLIDRVPAGSRVLEVGTASGYLGEYLVAEKKCELYGIEPVIDLYNDAQSSGYTKLYNKTVEEVVAEGGLSGQFDVILCGDVLEHMVDPSGTLAQLKKYLKPTGRVVISVPNIAHYSVRRSLLCGRFDRTETGIMDATHLQFFTKKTAKEMIEKSGLVVESVRPSAGYIERFGQRKLLGIGRKLLFAFPELCAVQFIFVAKL
jgi:2-polyprenyl-3-methyl-5-hydroxy-6-metoxy-1,4-benzoquinol methylase